jgi:hypothetical protein
LRPDIAYFVTSLTRALKTPTAVHMMALKKLGRYLVGTQHVVWQLKLDCDAPEDRILVYSDASWGSEAGRKSISGGIVAWRGVPLSFWSRTQAIIAQSTAEAELLALSLAVNESRLAQSLLRELGFEVIPRLYCDSTAAVALTARTGPGRIKHIDIRHLALQQQRLEGELEVLHAPGATNVADILTKTLPRPRLQDLSGRIGLQLQSSEIDEVTASEFMIASLEPSEDDDQHSSGWTVSDSLFLGLIAVGAIGIVRAVWRFGAWIRRLMKWCRHEDLDFVDPAFGSREQPGPRLDIRRRQGR